MRQGFSLVELSIFLTVLAVVLANMLPEQAELGRLKERQVTLERMQAIEVALMAYALDTGDLPCPSDPGLTDTDANFGVENQTGWPCKNGNANIAEGSNVASGGVPTRSLSLPDAYAFDGWGRKITYHVSEDNVGTYSVTGDVDVEDYSGSAVQDNAAFALVSHGNSAHGAWGRTNTRVNPSGDPHASERYNCNCANDTSLSTSDMRTVVQNAEVLDGTLDPEFDDIVRYRTGAELSAIVGSL